MVAVKSDGRAEEGTLMSDRGPNQDLTYLGPEDDKPDAKYRDAAYLGDSEKDDESEPQSPFLPGID